jgi:CspA family cold shock protein
MIGKVKWFDSKKGYGFILTDDGGEIFVHYTGIVAEGYKALTEGQNVEFEISENERGGRQAVEVKVVPKKKD